ncbi:MAG TPA: polysaccharide deacetylase family protein [Chryseolinea sp.]
MVFTGDEFADGGVIIAEVLKAIDVRGSFFLTGNFYKNRAFKPIIQRLKKDGHYLGAHSDEHLLYADWRKRDSTLVTRTEFRRDLRKNFRRMKSFGIKRREAKYFLPPFEWYNNTISRWTTEMNLALVNFSPGTRTTADYTYPGMSGYRTSDEIYRSVTDYESQSAQGLNGFILLTHIGTDDRRTDKFYLKLDGLIRELKAKGYSFVRIDEMLD